MADSIVGGQRNETSVVVIANVHICLLCVRSKGKGGTRVYVHAYPQCKVVNSLYPGVCLNGLNCCGRSRTSSLSCKLDISMGNDLPLHA